LRTNITLALLPLAAVLGMVAMAGCPGSLDDPNKFLDGGTAGSGCLDIPARFKEAAPKGCGGVGCHDPGQPQVDLISADLPSRLVGVTGTFCMTEVLADPSDPEGSALYLKLTDDFCGTSKMPLVGDPWTTEELECLAEWIGGLEGGGAAGPGSGGNGGTPGTGGMGGMGGTPGNGGMGGMGGSGGR
jgi:hypothetical protein